MTRQEIRQVIERFVAGDRPADIAAALGLDPAEVAAMCAGPTSIGQVAKAVAGMTPKAKRPRRKPADAEPARPAAPTAEADFDPAQASHRDGGTYQRNMGYGYASVRGGGRKVF
jgi:hypothetical protein